LGILYFSFNLRSCCRRDFGHNIDVLGVLGSLLYGPLLFLTLRGEEANGHWNDRIHARGEIQSQPSKEKGQDGIGEAFFNERLGVLLLSCQRGSQLKNLLVYRFRWLANPDNLEVDSYGNLLVHEDQYPGNVAAYGPNELLLVRPDLEIMPVLRGLDPYGEVTGMDWGDSEWRFFINWMSGANGSELLQIDCTAAELERGLAKRKLPGGVMYMVKSGADTVAQANRLMEKVRAYRAPG